MKLVSKEQSFEIHSIGQFMWLWKVLFPAHGYVIELESFL